METGQRVGGDFKPQWENEGAIRISRNIIMSGKIPKILQEEIDKEKRSIQMQHWEGFMCCSERKRVKLMKKRTQQPGYTLRKEERVP